VKRIRIDKPRIRPEHPGTEDLPADPRDPDVVRAKALARTRLAGSRGNRDQLGQRNGIGCSGTGGFGQAIGIQEQVTLASSPDVNSRIAL
jgi:hypothetical protein